MEKARLLIFAFLIAMVAFAIPKVYADWATAASVWTTDADGVDKLKFNIGEEVFVKWVANGFVNITVLYEDGTVDMEWVELGKSGTVSFVPSHGPGIYEIYCNGANKRTVAVALFSVIPDLALGTIMAVAAAFASFGMLKWRSKRMVNI